MFDWNDEEITDIIWGESGENDDHIVPYPKGREENALFPLRDYGKKQFNQGATFEENRLGAKKEFPGIKLENCHFEANEELSAPILGMELWPDLPPSRADKYDQDMGSEESNDFTNLTNFNLVKGEAELFGNDQEDQEDEGFLDYSWANIDNFDDLDRIFRNDDSRLDHEMIANTDELWSSSVVADVINGSSTQSFSTTVSSPSSDFQAIRPTMEQQTQFVAFKSQSGKGNKLSSVCPNNVQPSKDKGAEFVNQVTGGKPTCGVKREDSTETTAETKVPKFMESNDRIHAHVSEKVNRQRKLLKNRKRTEEMNETKFVKNRSGAWSPPMNQLKQLENTRISVSSLQSFPSPVLVGPESLRYLHASNPYMHNAYGYPVHQFHIMPQLPHIYSDRGLGQSLESSKVFPDSLKHANLLKQLPDPQSKPPIMTPQEKIEKLRRRQQIQAMLAIQRQQQKLGHQIYGPDSQGVQGNQCQDATANSIEVENNALNLQSSLEMNLLIDQDDSSKTALMVDEFLLAETILGQLQDAIRKLDKKAKLCIRDSLFRLARSAVQRHSANDTRSTNKSSRDKSEVIADEEMNSHDSSTRLPDAETDTNPIDRTVAHLLFHRPLDPSSGLHIKEGIPESSISASPDKFYPQSRTANSADSAAGLSSESLPEKQNTIQFESQNPSLESLIS